MSEAWVTAHLTDAQIEFLAEMARDRYPEAGAWPASTLVPNLLRDLLAETLEPLIGNVSWPQGGSGTYSWNEP